MPEGNTESNPNRRNGGYRTSRLLAHHIKPVKAGCCQRVDPETSLKAIIAVRETGSSGVVPMRQPFNPTKEGVNGGPSPKFSRFYRLTPVGYRTARDPPDHKVSAKGPERYQGWPARGEANFNTTQ